MSQLIALFGFGLACAGLGVLTGYHYGHKVGHAHQRAAHARRLDKFIDVIAEISPETIEVLEVALQRLQQLDAEQSVPPRSEQLEALKKMVGR